MPEKKAEKKNNTGLIAGVIGAVVAVVAIVVVIVIIIANGGSKLSGKYNVYSMKEGDTEVSADTLKAFGMADGYIEFKDGGKGVMNLYGQEQEFTYEGNKITADGETKEVKVDGDKITLEPTDSTSITFKK